MFVNDINKSRAKELVEPTMFDRHMVTARKTDISNKKKIFSLQTEVNEEKQKARDSIKPSIY